MTIHEIKRADPPLSDIAGNLRSLADVIEQGGLRPRAVVCVLAFHAPGLPSATQTYGFGEVPTSFEQAGILLAAATAATSPVALIEDEDGRPLIPA